MENHLSFPSEKKHIHEYITQVLQFLERDLEREVERMYGSEIQGKGEKKEEIEIYGNIIQVLKQEIAVGVTTFSSVSDVKNYIERMFNKKYLSKQAIIGESLRKTASQTKHKLEREGFFQ